MPSASQDPQDVLTVSGLNREAKRLLEQGLGRVRVEGELSNVARPASGHMYWTLKDGQAQIRCAMFRQANRKLPFRPDNGQQVVASGRVSLYEARGDYQLIVDDLEEAGEGALRRRFEALKTKLAGEGLFDPAAKRTLPSLPSRIGVVTSATGAALRDVLIALRRRFPAIPVLIYPTSVQGSAAAAEIVAALDTANRRQDCDLLILTRGGGSLEDLWPFNEEIVARAIAASTLPVIVGVGHETDFTIADFVADMRAPTPSQAAELAVPVQAEIERRLSQLAAQIGRITQRTLGDFKRRLDADAHRLSRVHPRVSIETRQQRLDDLETRMRRALEHRQQATGHRLASITDRLMRVHPGHRVRALEEHLGSVRVGLTRAVRMKIERRQAALALADRSLRALSPLATLERGYAIVSRPETGKALTRPEEAPVGADVDIRFAAGRLQARVTKRTEPD